MDRSPIDIDALAWLANEVFRGEPGAIARAPSEVPSAVQAAPTSVEQGLDASAPPWRRRAGRRRHVLRQAPPPSRPAFGRPASAEVPFVGYGAGPAAARHGAELRPARRPARVRPTGAAGLRADSTCRRGLRRPGQDFLRVASAGLRAAARPAAAGARRHPLDRAGACRASAPASRGSTSRRSHRLPAGRPSRPTRRRRARPSAAPCRPRRRWRPTAPASRRTGIPAGLSTPSVPGLPQASVFDPQAYMSAALQYPHVEEAAGRLEPRGLQNATVHPSGLGPPPGSRRAARSSP